MGYQGGAGMGDHKQMMQMMMRMRSQMMGGAGQGGMGSMGGQGHMLGGIKMPTMDADNDGTVTAEEARAALTAKLKEYDADGDGTLSIAEFETLHSANIRERMVDRFQGFDNNGDGQVTLEEMTAPADRMERMQAMKGQMGGMGQNMQGMGAADGAAEDND
ncbi:MAG: calcium-binding protein [Marinosulfonomonas sp.]|nr:MAG: calcium-binding protein [Marinosulfonomonas sp.]